MNRNPAIKYCTNNRSRSAGISTAFMSAVMAVVLLLLTAVPNNASAQSTMQIAEEDLPSPRAALLRSFVLPGWGHYYVDNGNWNRGKLHMGTDVALILSYFGLTNRANNLENDLYAFAGGNAGADLTGKDRTYMLAIGNFDNLEEYNDAQLQLRNWNAVYPNTAEYRWNWKSDALRNQYTETREKVDRNRSQLPTVVTLMVANRLLSGISAFVQARDMWENAPEATIGYMNGDSRQGIVANLRFSF